MRRKMHTRTMHTLFAPVVLAAAIALTTACGNSQSDDSKSHSATAPRPTATAKKLPNADLKPLTEWREDPGTPGRLIRIVEIQDNCLLESGGTVVGDETNFTPLRYCSIAAN